MENKLYAELDRLNERVIVLEAALMVILRSLAKRDPINQGDLALIDGIIKALMVP